MADDSDKKESAANTLIGEAVKKLFTAGVTAAFMTEESVRTYLAELKLPKEILNVIVQGQASPKTKSPIVSVKRSSVSFRKLILSKKLHVLLKIINSKSRLKSK